MAIGQIANFDSVIFEMCTECGAQPGVLCNTEMTGEFTAFPHKAPEWTEWVSLHTSRGRS
jgi:hypothetical protein